MSGISSGERFFPLLETQFSSFQRLNALQVEEEHLNLEIKKSVEKEGKKVDEFMDTYLEAHFQAFMQESSLGNETAAKLCARNVAMKKGYSSHSIDLKEKLDSVSEAIRLHPITVQKHQEESKKAFEKIERRCKTDNEKNQLETRGKELKEGCDSLKPTLKIIAISVVALSVLLVIAAIFFGKPDGKV